MQVVGSKVVEAYARAHADAISALVAWLAITKAAEWRSLTSYANRLQRAPRAHLPSHDPRRIR